MVPPVQVSPLIKTARWSALLVGIIYGKQRYDYLKPIAAEERRVEEAEKKLREEQERIYKQLAEGVLGLLLFTLKLIKMHSIKRWPFSDSLVKKVVLCRSMNTRRTLCMIKWFFML
uniref:ATP synthase F(0) complex subunit e, mitochondrial n=1 Tax=Pygocentrus nattereri TaxID=42514 RepID=A0A3B4BVZ2_PYGNA